MPVAKDIVADEKDKPVLNEEILAKLLEAAWVLQEHNRAVQQVELNLELHSEQLREREQAARISAPAPLPAEPAAAAKSNPEDYTFTLAKIVETQHQIQVRQLDLESSMEMVLERLIDIAKASGAAVGFVEGKTVRYRVGSGLSALPRGTEMEKERAPGFECLRTGQVSRCPDISSEFLLDQVECGRRGIQSLIAVPVYHDGGVAGALELYFAATHAFRESDVHSCQLMAGLVTEALARDEEATWKKSLAEERSVVLEALEKIRPNLAAFVGTPEAHPAAGASASEDASAQGSNCSSCGAELVEGEQYCGTCGSPRASAEAPPSFQSKLGAFLNAHPAAPVKETHPEPYLAPEDPFAPLKSPSPAAISSLVEPFDVAKGVRESGNEEAEEEEGEKKESEKPTTEPALAVGEDSAAWSSAAKARDFLEELATKKDSAFVRFWNARRGDIYLGVAVILVAVVIRWGIWSERSVSATGAPAAGESAHRRQPAPDADLSLLDKMLIGMGLADPPEAPENKGNPETQVWVDLHTALYYCPGADLYGKTPKGRYATQRDAQLDQFEPAYRKACE